MRTGLLFCIFMLFVTSCGGDHGSSSGKKTVPIIPERMEDILDQQSFRCQSSSGESCPFGIGRLFVINPSDPSHSAVCTGFLISGSRMLTNHHCVSTPRDCQNTFISIHTSAGPVKSHCQRIIFSDADSEVSTERSVDLTVMMIDAVPGPYFSISSSEQFPGKEVTAWVVDHLDLFRANITELTCQYDSRQASLVMRDCPAISGNSGSPIVLNGTRQAFAILWGSNLPPSIDASFPLNLRLELGGLSLATELFPLREEINGGESILR
jgi:hypothetical protein